jgi:hyperosmotically inducible protein
MNMANNKFLAVAACTFVLLLTGCQQEGAVEKAGKKVDQTVEQAGKKAESAGNTLSNKVESAASALDDAAITAKIKAEIINDPLLKVSEIEVTTVGGVVKLSGSVSSQTSIDRAQAIARGVKDVKSVVNGLVVKAN